MHVRLSLHLSKCHIVGNHVSRLHYVRFLDTTIFRTHCSLACAQLKLLCTQHDLLYIQTGLLCANLFYPVKCRISSLCAYIDLLCHYTSCKACEAWYSVAPNVLGDFNNSMPRRIADLTKQRAMQ